AGADRHKRGVAVLVLERDSSAGGTMKTIRRNGYLVEAGPNSALETTPIFKELVRDLRLENEFVYANPAGKNRFILKNGKLLALPLGPIAFLRTPLFSSRAKVRLLKEPFVGRANFEESIAQFVERRLGNEFLDYAINPFVAGVYAGEPERLSVRAAFPKLYALEERYGGLIRGMVGGVRERKKRAEKAKDRAETFSFQSGMQILPLALAASLGKQVMFDASATSVEPDPTGWRVGVSVAGQQCTFASDAVIISTPAEVSATLIRPLSAGVATRMDSIYYPPVASVFAVFDRSAISHSLDGFGFLIPARERRQILGALWSSSLFPHRCPENEAAFTIFVGGARQPELAKLDEDRIADVAVRELKSIMHIPGNPVYLSVTCWPKAIPQYEVGYTDIVRRIKEFESQHKGLYFCSNFIGGISVGDCVKSASETAERVGAHLRKIEL
ncbi:MAG: protoporphyrinogen oxidase, partial [Ignavibacteriales bacterium]|nr:protoporphyrinogen oxidase [Ignavibacteriales bacterium]